MPIDVLWAWVENFQPIGKHVTIENPWKLEQRIHVGLDHLHSIWKFVLILEVNWLILYESFNMSHIIWLIYFSLILI